MFVELRIAVVEFQGKEVNQIFRDIGQSKRSDIGCIRVEIVRTERLHDDLVQWDFKTKRDTLWNIEENL